MTEPCRVLFDSFPGARPERLSLHSLACVSQHTVCLWEAWLADNTDNGVETHRYTNTGGIEWKSHRGNSQLCTVNEKPACQDVPHSWTNKRGSGSLFSDTAGIGPHRKRSRKGSVHKYESLSLCVCRSIFKLLPLLLPYFISSVFPSSFLCSCEPNYSHQHSISPTEWGYRDNMSLAYTDTDLQTQCCRL